MDQLDHLSLALTTKEDQQKIQKVESSIVITYLFASFNLGSIPLRWQPLKTLPNQVPDSMLFSMLDVFNFK